MCLSDAVGEAGPQILDRCTFLDWAVDVNNAAVRAAQNQPPIISLWRGVVLAPARLYSGKGSYPPLKRTYDYEYWRGGQLVSRKVEADIEAWFM